MLTSQRWPWPRTPLQASRQRGADKTPVWAAHPAGARSVRLVLPGRPFPSCAHFSCCDNCRCWPRTTVQPSQPGTPGKVALSPLSARRCARNRMPAVDPLVWTEPDALPGLRVKMCPWLILRTRWTTGLQARPERDLCSPVLQGCFYCSKGQLKKKIKKRWYWERDGGGGTCNRA